MTDLKTSFDRVGDRSLKSPRQRLQVLFLGGLIMFTAIVIANENQTFLKSFSRTVAYPTVQTVPHYQIIVRSY